MCKNLNTTYAVAFNHSLLFNAKSFTYPFLFINPKLPMYKEITQSEHRKGEVCQCTEIRIYLVLVWFLFNVQPLHSGK